MRRRRTWWVALGSLLAIWSLAAAGIWTARALTPNADAMRALLSAQPLNALATDARSAFLDHVADELNRLDTVERRKVQLSDEIQALYRHMTSAERLRYLDRTRPPGTGAMARAFDGMSPDRRRRYMNRALDDLDTVRPDIRARMLRDGTKQSIEKIVRDGMAAGAGDQPSADALELQPFVEQAGKTLQVVR